MLNPQVLRKDARAIANEAGGLAHALDARHALAQLALTGTTNDVYYVDASTQVDQLLAQCFKVPASFVAQTAVYAREHGRMKDVPVLLLAWLASFDGELCERVFDRVIDNGAQLRSFVQVLRSGLVARKSLGTRPKRLVQRWLERASDEMLIQAMVGNAPSLADVIRMVHPRASSVERNALYAYIIGKPVDLGLLPQALQDFESFKRGSTQTLPKLPFQMLTAQPLSREQWMAIAEQAGWTMTRMNLNTFARHGVYESAQMVRKIAARLADPQLLRKAMAFPYQLLTTWRATGELPAEIREALRVATDLAVQNVPKLAGTVAVAVDVSGSMVSPVTGHRQGASTATRCVDVAGLMAAAVLARNPGAVVLPFNDRVRPWARPASNSVIETAQALAALLGGGTAVSAPLAELNRMGLAPDTVLIMSDNQSWMDARAGRETATQAEWRTLRRRNPTARLICIDLQPYTHTQAPDDAAVLNVGGFGDQLWQVIAGFSHGLDPRASFVGAVERVKLSE